MLSLSVRVCLLLLVYICSLTGKVASTFAVSLIKYFYLDGIDLDLFPQMQSGGYHECLDTTREDTIIAIASCDGAVATIRILEIYNKTGAYLAG